MNPQSARCPKRRVILLALFCVLVGNTFYDLVYPRFTAVDEIAFKAAGREWAQSGRFAAPELSGFLELRPPVQRVWFAHMPLYTMLFGVFVKVLGFGLRQSVLFDSLIHAAYALTTFSVVRRVGPGVPHVVAFLAALVALSLQEPGRADQLAGILGTLALVTLWGARCTVFRVLSAGVLLGGCAATHVVAGALFGSLILIVLWHEVRSWASAAVVMGKVTSVAVLVFGAALVLPLSQDTGAWRQFLTHASAQAGQTLGWGMRFSWRYGRPHVLLSGACVLIGIAGAASGTGREAGVGWSRVWGVPIAMIATLCVLTPAKFYYLDWLIPWAVGATAVTVWHALQERAVGIVALAVTLGLVTVVGLAPALGLSYVVGPSLNSGQSPQANAQWIRRHVPRGETILASEYWPMLGNDYRYYSMVHGRPAPAEVNYVILTGNGTGNPGVPEEIPAAYREEVEKNFELVWDNLNRQPVTIIGRRVSNSGWGWGAYVLRRRSATKLN